MSVGTAQTAIPKGAKLRVGAGFRSSITQEAHAYFDPTRGIVIALAPLLGGTNDPEALGRKWEEQTGVSMTGKLTVTSAGKPRPAVTFAGELNGTKVNQVVVLYFEPAYRLGVLYQAPSAMFADSEFQRQVMAFFARNVVLP
jgi:hypothetical protein